MQLVRDAESFQRPLEAAIAAAVAEVHKAADPVAGAEARVRKALDEKADLEAFCARLTQTMRSGAFVDLPRLRDRRWRPLPNCHHLTVGPWRGVFLVKRDENVAIAILFSKAPHDLSRRVGELAHSRDSEAEAPCDSEPAP